MKKRGIVLLVVGIILLIALGVELNSLIELDKAEKEANKIASSTRINYSFTGDLTGNTAKDASNILSNPDKIEVDSTDHDAAQRTANGYMRKYNEKFEQVCILIPIVAVYFIILIIIRKKTDWFSRKI